MAMEHDRVQRKLLRPDLIYDYVEERTITEDNTSGYLAFNIGQGHTVIEADISAERADWNKPMILSDSELLTWVKADRSNSPIQNKVRILFCQPVQARPPTLSVTEGFIQELENYFAVPPEFFRTLHRSLPVAFQFESAEAKSGTKLNGLIMRNQSAWLMEFTLLHIHVPSRNISTSICFGLTSMEIRKMLAYLASSQRSGVCHLLLPFLLVDESIEASSSFIQRRRETVEYMQQETNLDMFLEAPNPDTQKARQVDMQLISKRLTSFSTSIATLICSAKAHQRFVQVLGRLCLESPEYSTRSKSLMQSWVMPKFKTRLKYLEDVTVAIEDEGAFLQTSIQSQVQTVHNLIAQSDFEVQRNISALSMEMAKLTQRDSTNMRIIAGVTLVFLPGTFTATLFSTSFFGFQLGITDPHVVSGWFWLYWVVTAPLTLLVLAAWLYVTHHENTKTNARLWEKGDNEKRIDKGSKVKKDQRRVNERFDYGAQDAKMLDEHLIVLTATNVSIDVPNENPPTVLSSAPPVLSNNKPVESSSGTVPSLPSNTAPTLSTSIVPGASTNADPAASTNTDPAVPNNTDSANSKHTGPLVNTVLQELTEEARARLHELERREQDDKDRRVREQQDIAVAQEIARRQPPKPPRIIGMGGY